MDGARCGVPVEGLHGAGVDTGWVRAEAADVGVIDPQGLDLGHVDAGRGRTKATFMSRHAGHFAGPAATAKTLVDDDPLHYPPLGST